MVCLNYNPGISTLHSIFSPPPSTDPLCSGPNSRPSILILAPFAPPDISPYCMLGADFKPEEATCGLEGLEKAEERKGEWNVPNEEDPQVECAKKEAKPQLGEVDRWINDNLASHSLQTIQVVMLIKFRGSIFLVYAGLFEGASEYVRWFSTVYI